MRELPTALKTPSWYYAIANSPLTRMENSFALQLARKMEKFQLQDRFLHHFPKNPIGCIHETPEVEPVKPIVSIPKSSIY